MYWQSLIDIFEILQISFLNFCEKALTCGEEDAGEGTNIDGNNKFNESSGNISAIGALKCMNEFLKKWSLQFF